MYDAIGNLVQDKAENLTIAWNVYGKIDSIVKPGGIIKYTYDAAGNRISKSYDGKTTVYVRDASGNVMSIYQKEGAGALDQHELHLYGSSRLGLTGKRTTDPEAVTLATGFDPGKLITFTRGEKIFELSNHLGNVLVTINDKKLATDDGNGEVAYYEADVVTANDYYPFGMIMPGRKYAFDDTYRYGFNGKENDNEVKGEGGQQDYGMRIYDPRLGKFLSVDPLTRGYPMLTPYQFASNTPIAGVDLEGLEFLDVNSSIYQHKYLGSTSFLNFETNQRTTYDNYGVHVVYHNIPEALQDEANKDLKFTRGGPVTAMGRDYDPAKDGAIVYRTGRYYNPGPEFYGAAFQPKDPSRTGSTQGVYSFKPDDPNDPSTGANTAQESRVRSVATVGPEIKGLVGNWTNQSIWKASIKEQGDRRYFYAATKWVNGFISAGKLVNFPNLASGGGKSDLINFFLDGTLPFSSSKNEDLSLEQLTYKLDVFKVGIHFLSYMKGIGEDVKTGAGLVKVFDELLKSYEKTGGNVSNYQITKEQINQ